MIARPAFNPYYIVHTIGDEGVVLLSEDGSHLLKGRLYCLVAPWIDGKRTVDDIVTQVAHECSAVEVYYTLNRLEQQGYLVEMDAPPDGAFDAGRTAFWKGNDLDYAVSEERLRETTVAVRTVGAVDPEPFVLALQETGLQVDAVGDMDIVVTDDYLRPELAEINKEALVANRSWLLAKTVGAEIWLGPIFRPEATGCWQCLAHRLAGNREVARYVELRLKKSKPITLSIATLPSTEAMGRHMIVTEAAKWLASDRGSSLEGKLITLDTRTWRTEEHILTRRPQCAACGNPLSSHEQEARPIQLRSRKKVFTADGGHRAVSLEATLKAYDHHVSPITGVVQSLQQPPGNGEKELLIHLYVSGHNMGVARCALDDFRRHFRASSAGKGMTEMEAKVGALAEAIERYSGVFQPESDPRRFARYVDLKSEAIHPYDYLLFSEKQYREREAWNARRSSFNWVPEPFDEKAAVAWTPAWSLTEKRYKYVPTMSCYFGYRPERGEPLFSRACSNGNAAGNTIEEAIVQGFFELVERDAIAIWWYNRLRKPAVDLESFNEPYFTRLRERYRALGRDLWVLDIMSDLGVPTFAAVSRRISGGRDEILFGFGAHFEARIAVSRALTEMNQMLGVAGFTPTPKGTQGPTLGIDDPETLNWLKSATLENQPYLAPAEGAPFMLADDYPAFESDDLLDDILRCQALVEGIGLEMLVLDLTRPDIGMPTVKVIVPGLRHFWARFAPGRLYDVPVAMGDLTRPLQEEELNPIPMFL